MSDSNNNNHGHYNNRNNNEHDNNIDENSPLVSPVKPDDEFLREVEDQDQEILNAITRDRQHGLHDQESKSTLYLFLLTLSIGG